MVTHTASAATATVLRVLAPLKTRFLKEAKKNAPLNPFKEGTTEAFSAAFFHIEIEECDPPYFGGFLLCINKGGEMIGLEDAKLG